MYRLMILTTLLLQTACASTPVSQTAICDGTEASRKALAAALVEDGGANSQRAGLRLLDQLHDGCHP
ncbi:MULTISPECIES: hypothetical protein [unclassified Paracoccus (in: a-proteobacteria)]|uniref:hypothetical protein n=1 Tax=unclassified Paracoccus (in: a-proteobacteria) TaxID=2688777 RepID=UPI0012B283E3|nr:MULTISPECIES: hypothetical protein [unclassified Paracoccus (in: a-proteobacteria)]UXU73841.1 hypothetical protein GB879_007795 [Paracoccus sp. SMMA_5]UXU79729.1 hypothetical protein GB880_007775 [Paracoccus sp. SMMA_5_TC]